LSRLFSIAANWSRAPGILGFNLSEHRMQSVAGHRFAAAIALACIAALAACASVNDLLKPAPRPTARISGATLQGLTLEQVDLLFDIEVTNPYEVNLPLADLGYAIGSGGHKLVEGSVQPSGAIPARGTKVIQVPARIAFNSVMSVLKGVRPGSVVPYTADFNLGVDAPVVGRLNLPLSHKGEVPLPVVPEVSLVAFDIDSLSFDKVEASAKLQVKNTNQFDLGVTNLGLNLAIGGKDVARTRLAHSISVASGQSVTIEVPLSFSPRAFGAGLFDLLNGSQAGYSISGFFDAATRFGPISLPFSHDGNASIVK
jgi:LEA14-like dessication related protein